MRKHGKPRQHLPVGFVPELAERTGSAPLTLLASIPFATPAPGTSTPIGSKSQAQAAATSSDNVAGVALFLGRYDVSGKLLRRHHRLVGPQLQLD